MTLRELAHLLRPLRTAIANTIARGTLKLLDDAKKFQSLQVELLDEEVRSEVERMQEYGFTSVPLEGAQVLVGFIGGKRDHGVVFKCDDRRYRLKGLENGEVAVYTDEGDKMVFKRGGTVEITASTKVRIVSPLVEMDTDLKVEGNLEVVGTSLLTGDVTAEASVDVTGTVSADQVSANQVIDGGKVLGTHTHDVGLTLGSCTGGALSGTVTSGAPN